jgi:hypothetical protein
MAGAVGAFGADAETLWVNPAGLGGLRSPRISLTGLLWRSGVESQYLLSGLPLSRGWAVGLAVNRNAATDAYRDGSGTDLGSFEVSDTVLSGTVAYRHGRVSVGSSLKWVHERVVTYRGSAFLADVGLQVLPLNDWVAVGLAYQNLGQHSSLSPGTRPPETMRFSAAVRVYWPSCVLVSECRYLRVRKEFLPAVGVQFSQRVWPFGVALRGGYDFQDLRGLAGSGWTGGLGFAWRDLRLDYMFSPDNLLGTRQRLTMGWEFQTSPGRVAPNPVGRWVPVAKDGVPQAEQRPLVVPPPEGWEVPSGVQAPPPLFVEPLGASGTLAAPKNVTKDTSPRGGLSQPEGEDLQQEPSLKTSGKLLPEVEKKRWTSTPTPFGRMKVEVEYSNE